MLALPNQTPGLAARLGLARADVDRAAWAITPDGRRYEGAAAVNRLFQELGGVWAVLGRIAALPGLWWCERQFYVWFARNRGRFARWGAMPACERPDVSCEREHG